MHLGQERPCRRTLALERLDAFEPVQYCACLVHVPTDATRDFRTCL